MSAAALGVIAGLLDPVSAADTVQKPVWTLEVSVRRALDTAPEVRVADAQVTVREGGLRQADAWPNPAVELRADQKLGIEDSRGGTDLTQVAISQPLPLWRLTRQRRVAEAQLASEHENRRYQHLLLEQQVAQTYHALQLDAARYALARERRDLMEEIATTRDRLVRYLAPAERGRLGILRAQAAQAIASAEGEYAETAAHLRALLALPAETEPQPTPLVPAISPAPLDTLLARLAGHPGIAGARLEQDAARAGIDAARSQRSADPVLSLFRERDFFGGQRREFGGVTLSVQIPLWNLNNGGVTKAVAETEAARARHDARARDLDARLRKSHLHLNHLIEQAVHHRSEVLEPSARLFALTRKSFATGEVNVLTLVDAHDNYFSARSRYLELLTQQWLEATDLRLAAGQSLLATEAAP
ncbi:MAG: hypothetical protein A2638_00075 [Nitrospirae bacterium RIFCSPHIGHO2_01_FULL_66_17]|nr:MAG: hypothetical protein A2638_00075 [Nitrospirae bacterium RIFCSPHIGHO2_01_FULL_66_17]